MRLRLGMGMGWLAWPLVCGTLFSAQASTRRLALMIGENDGGRDRVRLQYAISDAITFAGSMSELGGVESGDIQVLRDISVAELDTALARLQKNVEAAVQNGNRVEAILYYSGHADEKGLLLRGRHYAFHRFRAKIDQIPAAVRITVVDACASGALTKRKGGRSIPAFLADVSRQTNGYAILTSSSSDESAQESDRIRASFFSHYLNIGLRGAADASQDGRITLHEAYEYAYRETLARTEGTVSGPQHASYDMNMSGSGDIVMTELRRATSTFVLPDSVAGRFFIRDMRDRLLAEVHKQTGKPLRLALDPGQYQVHWQLAMPHARSRENRSGEMARQGNLILKKGDDSQVFDDMVWRETGLEKNETRGTMGPILGEGEWNGNWDDSSQYHRFYLKTDRDFKGTLLTWGINRSEQRFDGEQFAMLWNTTVQSHKGLQAAGLWNVARGQMRGGQVSGVANFGLDDVRGLQLTSGFNVAHSLSQGIQVSDFFNYVAGSGIGVQFSPFSNWVGGSFSGMQFAFFLNYAGSQMKGMQWLGFINWVNGPVDGNQVGILNVAHSYRSGSPIGIFNFVKSGVWRGETWVDETGFQHYGLLTGTRFARTRIAIGSKPLSKRDLGALTVETAAHWKLASSPGFYWEPGLMASVIGNDGGPDEATYPDFLHRLRFTIGAHLGPYLSLGAGLSWAWLITPLDRSPITGRQAAQFSFYDNRMRMWPGAHISLQVGTLGAR
jgi:Caspase domain